MGSPEPEAAVIRYTTKELLAEIRDGISMIKNTQQQHENRLAAVERITGEWERRVPAYDELVKSMDVQDQVQAALSERKDKGFTRREKVLGLLIAVCVLGVQAYSAIAHF